MQSTWLSALTRHSQRPTHVFHACHAHENSVLEDPKALIAPSTTTQPQPFTVGLLPFSLVAKCGSRPRPCEDESFGFSFFVFDVVVEDVLLRLFLPPFIAYLYQPSSFDHPQAWRKRFGEGPDRTTL
jgi:hypothetical protein